MPRIDPKQLLDTLRPLITPSGGIKGQGEVIKLSQLMQRFSKKLVSKLIYIQILKSTEEPLLDSFLSENGWELLNSWFADAIRDQNWSLCLEMIRLFDECPITADRLKEGCQSGDQILAPKLINQLRLEPTVAEGIRSLAGQVYAKWVAIVSPVPPPAPPSAANSISERPTRSRKANLKPRVDPSAPIESSGSESDGSDDAPVRRPTVRPLPKGPTIKSLAPPRKPSPEKKVDLSTKNDLTSISLLQSLADEVDENIKKEEIEKKAEEAAVAKKKLQLKENSKAKEKTTSSKSKDERTKEGSSPKTKRSHSSSSDRRDRDRDTRDSKRSRHYDPRDEVDDREKQRIKEMARKMREEQQKKTLVSTGSLGKIPKVPKKPVDPEAAAAAAAKKDQESKKESFASMLGTLDSKPKNVKTSTVKNKTAAMLEGMSKPPSKSSSSSSSSSKDKDKEKDRKDRDKDKDRKDRRDRDRDHHHSSSSSSHRSSSDGHHRSSKDSPSSKSSSSKDSKSSSSSRHHHDSSSSSSKKLLLLGDKETKRKSSIDSAESPKIKSPTSYKESNGFMDDILGVMGGSSKHTSSRGSREDKDKAKQRKRRNSDRENSDTNSVPSTKTSKPNSSPSESDSETKKPPAPDQTEDVKPEVKKEEEEKPEIKLSLGFFRDTLETPEEEKPEAAGEEDPEKSETAAVKTEMSPPRSPEDTKPREVGGILVYHRGRDKRNKSIRFKPDSEIVAVRYFELDEGERINVNKVKFEEMKKFELNLEKHALKQGGRLDAEGNDHGGGAAMAWYPPVKATFEGMKDEDIPALLKNGQEPGKESSEKAIQAKREQSVLQVMYFKKDPPSTPAEPDAAELARAQAQTMDPEKRPTNIPLDDQNGDDDDSVKSFVTEGWPAPKTNEVDQQANMTRGFSLPPALSSLLSTIGSQGLANFLPAPGAVKDLSEEEQSTLQAQVEALQALKGIQGGPSSGGPGGNAPPGFSSGPPPTAAPSGNAPSGFAPQGPPPFGGMPPGGRMPSGPGGGPPGAFNAPPPGFGGHNGGPPPPQGPFGGGPPMHQQQQQWNNGPGGWGNNQGNNGHHFNGNRGGGGNHNNGGGRGGGYGNGGGRWDNQFRGGPPGNGGYNNRGGQEYKQNRPMQGGRPCKFFSERGYCREGDSCGFAHIRRN